MPSGVTVASLDTGSAVSSVAVLVKAGARNESSENLGASQALRLAASLSNSQKSGFATSMNIEQAGGKIDVIGSREYILYSSQAPRNVVGDGNTIFMSNDSIEIQACFFLQFWDIFLQWSVARCSNHGRSKSRLALD